MNRTIVIGDIHGCLVEFQELIARVDPRPNDRVVCLGDFFDKGPYPAECVKFARESGFESVMGNHEERHIRWWQRERARRETGQPNNMRPFCEADRIANERLTPFDIEWLSNLPPVLELIPGWVAVHGGFLPGPIASQDMSKVLRVRWVELATGKHVKVDYDKPETLGKMPPGSVHWTDAWKGSENVVFGHEAFRLSEPTVFRHGSRECWSIDTGAVHGGRLTALILPSKEVVQVQAVQKYQEAPAPIPA